jgi:hypothetical protein
LASRGDGSAILSALFVRDCVQESDNAGCRFARLELCHARAFSNEPANGRTAVGAGRQVKFMPLAGDMIGARILPRALLVAG